MKLRVPGLFLAGSALVLLVNAVVLAGVAWNRSGTPEAVLQLGERELERPMYWQDDREDSGLALTLRWRLPVADSPVDGYLMHAAYGPAGWLDAARLEALGFKLPPLPEDGTARLRHPLARELWLVLEFDGPAYAHSLQVARDSLAAAESALQANPADPGSELRAENARELFQRASEEWSRLFVVDAGREPGALRARYVDRERHAIVRGRVRPFVQWNGPAGLQRPEWRGQVEAISVARINVPLPLRQAFGTLPGDASPEQRARYEVMLAYGRRGEPWILAAKPMAAAP